MFSVDMEFDVSVVVKATNHEVRNEDYPSELADLEYAMNNNNNNSNSNNNRKKRKNRKKRVQGGGSNNYDLSDVGMKEIESLLKDFDVNQGDLDLFEDEAILGTNGLLDVGELISQMFRLKLDPYPKKPGSEPVSYSITG